MKFYHNFYTDLPDQFVEANSAQLIRWIDGWADKNRYFRRSMIVDMVSIDVVGHAKTERWPTLKNASARMTEHWMNRKGESYNGRYWESLTEDQRSPVRVARDTGKDDRVTINTILPRSFFSTTNASTGLISWEKEKPKPPLKREGIIAGEIVGYRCWRIENGMLRSVYQSDVWKPGEILAGRELGDWDSRGIHAWKDGASKQYHDYIRSYLNQDHYPFLWAFINGDRNRDELKPAMVTGTVFLWGDVVEHERGYRAEYARIRSLDWLYPDASMMGREGEFLNGLRAKYDVLS